MSTYWGVHSSAGEFLTFSDGASSSLLESDTLKSLMHVQCVISGRVLHLLFLSVFGFDHPVTNQLNKYTINDSMIFIIREGFWGFGVFCF